jgi:hypothetical protein
MANATDGANPLAPASFTAVADLARRPPSGRRRHHEPRALQARPAGVGRQQAEGRKEVRALPPRPRRQRLAIFGGGPLGQPDVTASLAGTTPLRGNPRVRVLRLGQGHRREPGASAARAQAPLDVAVRINHVIAVHGMCQMVRVLELASKSIDRMSS